MVLKPARIWINFIWLQYLSLLLCDYFYTGSLFLSNIKWKGVIRWNPPTFWWRFQRIKNFLGVKRIGFYLLNFTFFFIGLGRMFLIDVKLVPWIPFDVGQ